MIILVAFLSCIHIVMAYNYISVLIALFAVINIVYGPPRSENGSRRPREAENNRRRRPQEPECLGILVCDWSLLWARPSPEPI